MGSILVRTIRHFWPRMGEWLGRLPDTRFEPMVVYDKKFLTWWGLCLFLLKLGGRRQLDFHLRDLNTHVRENVNRLAETDQETLPVHGTLDHFLGHVGSSAFRGLRTDMISRLIRMRALDESRLLGCLVLALDGTGYLRFRSRHCPSCLTRTLSNGQILYLHPVLEAKIVTPEGLALSVETEFIENDDGDWYSGDNGKQDCELTAAGRLTDRIKEQFPQLHLCVTGDSLYGCGRAIQDCRDHKWDFIFVFKEGRTPALWREFQALLTLSPDNHLSVDLPDGVKEDYRWINGLLHEDSDGRSHQINAIQCIQTKGEEVTTFGWMTSFAVTRANVAQIAAKGGRNRWKIENEGFNIQKNSGLNLEHGYSTDPELMRAYYVLLQIAHMILQLVEKGSPLKHLARLSGKTPDRLWGGLANLARRFLDAFRYCRLPDVAFDLVAAASCQIRVDSS